MAFEKVSLQKKYFKYSTFSKNDVICEGTWIKNSEDNYGKSNFHLVSKDKDCVYILNSSGHLNHIMKEEVSLGDFIRVTYDGTYVLEKGKYKGTECHQFIVERDPELSTTITKKDVKLEEDVSDDEDLSL